MATVTSQKKAAESKAAKDTAKDDKEGTEGKHGKKKLLLIVLILVLALGGAGGAYFMLGKKSGPPPAPKPGEMVKMDAMTLSLADQHYLKVQVAIQLVDGKAKAADFKQVKAEQLVIDTFSDRNVNELNSNAARDDLKSQLLTGLQEAYPKEVYGVYLTQFVIQ